jgi:hypothetical protein
MELTIKFDSTPSLPNAETTYSGIIPSQNISARREEENA